MTKKNLVFIGDSLTEGFDWQQRFPDHHVVNLGLSGEPIEGLIARLQSYPLRQHDPDLLFMMTGINNLRRGDHDIAGRQQQLLSMLHHALPADKIVVQSILPVTMWVPRELIEHLNDNLKKMAGDFSMHYLDLYPLFLTPKGVADASCLQEDGIHLTQEGYRRWSDAIERFLMNKHE